MRSDWRFSVEKITDEYRRIDAKWLKMHYQAMLWLVFASIAIEIGMCFVMMELKILSICFRTYILKYALMPMVCNLLLLVFTHHVLNSPRSSDRKKIYTVSLTATMSSLVIYTIHSIFSALFLIFAIPLILTIIYGDQLLTSIVAALCLIGKVVADLFIFWDPDRPSVFVNQYTTADFFISLLLMVLFYGLCLFMITVEREKNNVSIELEKERERLQANAVTDELTGIGNRQALRKAFEEMERSCHAEYALAMMDLDDFKSLNDNYGHTRGDSYLRELGDVLRSLESPNIRAFRFGGDEFCILLRGEDAERIGEVCREIQSRFADTPVNRKFLMVSISIGTAVHIQGEAPARLLERADTALYRAKQKKGVICAAE